MAAPSSTPHTVATLLQDAQRSAAAAAKAGSQLQKLQATDYAGFTAGMFAGIHRLLTVFKREPAVERMVAFFAKYAAGAHAGEFSVDLLRHLIAFHNASDKAVRLRVCQLIGAVLTGLPEDAEIDDELWQRMQDSLVARLRDKVPAVRVEAIQALARLQDPEDIENVIVVEFVRLLTTDSSPLVRIAALKCIYIAPHTMDAVLSRVRDIHEDVRAAAYTMIAEKLTPLQLTIAQRAVLLRDGLADRVPAVSKAARNMAIAWLAHTEFDVTKLLTFMDVVSHEDIAHTLLTSLFEEAARPNDAHAQQSQIAAACKQVFVRTAASSHIHTQPGSDEFDECVQSVSSVSQLLHTCLAADIAANKASVHSEDGTVDAQPMFIARQVLLVAKQVDYSDEVGRRRMVNTLLFHLGELWLSEELLVPLLHALAAAELEEAAFVRAVAQVISDVNDPLEGEDDHSIAAREAVAQFDEAESRIRADMNDDLDDADTKAANDEMLTQIAKQKAQVLDNFREAESFLSRSLRCLCITRTLFERTKRPFAFPELSGLATTIIRPAVSARNALLREQAMLCLGFCCQADPSWFTSNGRIMLGALQSDAPCVQRAAAQVLLDLLLIYGLDAVKSEADRMLHADLMTTLEEKLKDSTDLKLQNLTITGIAKLLFARRIVSESMLKELLLQGTADPASFDESTTTLDDDEGEVDIARLLQERVQFLSVFFSAFAAVSSDHQTLLANITPSCVQALIARESASGSAKNAKAAAATRFENSLSYLLFLLGGSAQQQPTADAEAKPAALSAHAQVAVPLAIELAANPDGDFARSLCKALSSLTLSSESTQSAVVAALLDDAARFTCDSVLARMAKKLAETLDVSVEAEDAISAAREQASARRPTGAAASVATSRPRRATASAAAKPAAKPAAKTAAKGSKAAGAKKGKAAATKGRGRGRKAQSESESEESETDEDMFEDVDDDEDDQDDEEDDE